MLIVVGTATALHAQNTKADKKAAKAAEIKKMIDAANYVFVAEFATPQRGGSRSLSSGYDLTVSKNKIVAYLPYFGRVYSAPMDASEGGIKLTSVKFVYRAKQNKKGDWEITIKPEYQSPSGARDVQLFRLNVSSTGSAILMVSSINRDFISFNGYIEQQKSEDKP